MRILIVADERLRREALAAVLISRGVAFASTSAPDDALKRARQDKFQVALLDVRPEAGLTLVAQLLCAVSELRSVVIGVSEEEADLVAWAEAGVAAYVTMDDSLDDLMATIANVVHGDTRFSPRVSGSLVRRMEVLASALSIATLTARETQVAELLAEGLSNKEIASCLMIAIPTVKAHVHSILGKLNARRRGEAVARMHPGGVARLRLDPEAQTRAVPAYRRRPGQTGVI